MLRWRRIAPAVRTDPSAARRASRADVPLPHGERSTSPSAKTVTLRWVSATPAAGRLAVGSSCQKITP